MDLKNNIALVTGGASGLGRGTVEHFVSRGCKVAILDINDEKANDVIELLGEENVIYFNTDVMNEDSVKNAINGIKDNFGKLNFIVNCAGTGYGARILGKNGPHPLDIFKFIIDLNLVGTFNVMRLGAELIDVNDPDEKGEKGVVINTASIAGYEGQIGQSAYAASKAGIAAYSKTLAIEYAKKNINVNCVSPGFIKTEMTDKINEEFKKILVSKIPSGDLGTGEDVSNCVAFLASDMAKYINGETINVNGGMYMA